jgi:hypothetical protein
MIYGYDTSRKTTNKVVKLFCEGANGQTRRLDQLDLDIQNSNVDDYFTSFGILRGTAEVYRKAPNYIHIDHAYFLAGHKKTDDSWYRVTKNGINMKDITKHYPEDRFNTYFKQHVNIKPWSLNTKGHILVLPPTQPTAWYTGDEDWLDNTLKWLKDNTDRKVIVRHKPPVIHCDNQGFPIDHIKFQEKFNEMKHLVRPTTLDEDLDNAYCVVAYNSGAVVKATLEGVPVFSTEYASSKSVAFDWNDIENHNELKQEPNRQQYCNALSYHQYTLSEMKNGKAWQLIREWVT